MNTPVVDFLRQYPVSGRFHMPGHKGKPFLGCEAWTSLRWPGRITCTRRKGFWRKVRPTPPGFSGRGRLCTARRAPASVSGPCWPWPAGGLGLPGGGGRPECPQSLCLCLRPAGYPGAVAVAGGRQPVQLPPVPGGAGPAADGLSQPPAAVYLTSPDYLGGQADIAAMAQVCHQRNILLLVDNAHGAYLHWLDRHPLDLGADMCCDSAHKTLPVLTGGAYLHLSRRVCPALAAGAKAAMAMFGSTSPFLSHPGLSGSVQPIPADGYAHRLAGTLTKLSALRRQLTSQGWRLLDSDPLRLTVDARAGGLTGHALAQRLAGQGLGGSMPAMSTWCSWSPQRISRRTMPGCAGPWARLALPCPSCPSCRRPGGGRPCPFARPCSVPKKRFRWKAPRAGSAPPLRFPAPPPVPVAVSGEVIGPAALALFRRYAFGKWRWWQTNRVCPCLCERLFHSGFSLFANNHGACCKSGILQQAPCGVSQYFSIPRGRQR